MADSPGWRGEPAGEPLARGPGWRGEPAGEPLARGPGWRGEPAGEPLERSPARRRLLAAAVTALPLAAAGCKGAAALGTPPRPAPDVAVARHAIALETQLITRYDAVIAAVPGLAAPLRPLLAQHRDHLDRLRARLIVPPGARATPAARAGRRRPQPVPGTAAAALAYLRDAETAAAGSLLAHLAAAPPSLAQLLASISASEATHALILGAGRPP